MCVARIRRSTTAVSTAARRKKTDITVDHRRCCSCRSPVRVRSDALRSCRRHGGSGEARTGKASSYCRFAVHRNPCRDRNSTKLHDSSERDRRIPFQKRRDARDHVDPWPDRCPAFRPWKCGRTSDPFGAMSNPGRARRGVSCLARGAVVLRENPSLLRVSIPLRSEHRLQHPAIPTAPRYIFRSVQP